MINEDEHQAFVEHKQLLIVEQDDVDRQELALQLRAGREYGVWECPNGGEALQTLEARRYDMVLLDVDLSDIDGHAICRLIRRRNKTMPIIMMAANSSHADEVLSFDSGASGYMTKPIRLAVLLANIRALFRQYDRCEDVELKIGPYLFRPGVNMLVDSTTRKRIHLTEKEAAVLKLIYRSEEKAVGRDVLLEQVWHYHPKVKTHTVESHVYRLRQKMELDPANPALLVTTLGGYQLIP